MILIVILLQICIKMISANDLRVLSHLRKDARKKVTDISRDMKIPVTTIYDKIRSHKKKGIIKKHVSIIDFSKLGLYTTLFIALRTDRISKNDVEKILTNSPNINSLYKVNYGYDYLVEGVFKNLSEAHQFIEKIESLGANQIQVYNTIETIKKEHTLTEPEHFGILD